MPYADKSSAEYKAKRKQWDQAYYQSHKKQFAEYRDKRRKELQTQIWEYKKARPCAYGEGDPFALTLTTTTGI